MNLNKKKIKQKTIWSQQTPETSLGVLTRREKERPTDKMKTAQTLKS